MIFSVFHRESCQRGWRLLYILTAYYKCSEALKPYLLKYLQDVCASPGVHFQGILLFQLHRWNTDWWFHKHDILTGISKACEQNLRKTFQYGGRVEHPDGMELKAMLVSCTLTNCNANFSYIFSNFCLNMHNSTFSRLEGAPNASCFFFLVELNAI